MLVLSQDKEVIYNLAYAKKVELQIHYWGVEQIPMVLLLAHTDSGETKILGKYTDMEIGKEILQELLEAAAQGIETYKVPPIND